MSSLQKEIAAWGFKTFGVGTVKSYVNRIKQEMDELLETNSENKKDIMYELADIHIISLQLAELLDEDLEHYTKLKHRINLARKWKLNGDGTGQHVSE